MLVTANVNEFKQNALALINSALKSKQDIRIITQDNNIIFTQKISPELMTDQEYIESIPGLKDEILAGRGEKGTPLGNRTLEQFFAEECL